MISKILAFSDSSGNTYGTLEAAQRAEIQSILMSSDKEGRGITPSSLKEVIDLLFKHKEKLIDILTTTESSKPRARKIHGATRTRKPKKHIAEQFPLPMPNEDNTKPAA